MSKVKVRRHLTIPKEKPYRQSIEAQLKTKKNIN